MADVKVNYTERVKLVRERLAKLRPKIEPRRVPAYVERARKIVEGWERDEYERRDKRRLAFDKAANAIREELLFGNTEKALAALKKLEANHG